MATPEILVRARNAFKMGEYPLVEKLALRILEDEPESAVAYNLLGSVVRKDGPFPQGHRAVPEGRGHQARLYRGAQQSRGDLQAHRVLRGGHPAFRAGDQSLPQRGDVYYNLGNVYKALDNNGLAEENFSKAIAVDPASCPPTSTSGTVLEAAGRYGDAIRIYQKGLQADSHQPRLHYNLGVVYERVGRLKEAREEYEAAARGRPGGRTRSTTSASCSTSWVRNRPRRRTCARCFAPSRRTPGR